MRRRYYSAMSGGMPNTCSIRSLKKAFIGVGVRMSSDKNTIPFDNVPMKGMLIEKYTEQGFHISHPSLPRSVWVNFDQLPLTRLQINNGVIADEITFVENIVNHQMQLIRTLDTEYMDMIFKEKGLEEKKEEIIPISAAIPGQIYIGAQCEEGTEMIYLGTFFVKSMSVKADYDYYRFGSSRESIFRYYFEKLSPSRAFFAVPTDEISKTEEEMFEKQFFGSSDAKWKMPREKREEIEKQKEKAKKEYLANQKVPRYKILQFAVTSKRIKEVILTNQENEFFKSREENLKSILSFLAGEISESPKYVLGNRYGLDDVFFISENKNTIIEEGKKFATEKKNITIQERTWEERFKKD